MPWFEPVIFWFKTLHLDFYFPLFQTTKYITKTVHCPLFCHYFCSIVECMDRMIQDQEVSAKQLDRVGDGYQKKELALLATMPPPPCAFAFELTFLIFFPRVEK